jgi:hypothetical protein
VNGLRPGEGAVGMGTQPENKKRRLGEAPAVHNIWHISFPSTGGVAVSSYTLPAFPRGPPGEPVGFSSQGSEMPAAATKSRDLRLFAYLCASVPRTLRRVNSRSGANG